MPVTFPGAKILTLGPVMQNLKGETDGVAGQIQKAKLIIPLGRITGPDFLALRLKTEANYEWEDVQNNVEHTFNNPGTKLYIQLIGSGIVLSAVNETDGSIVPAIIAKVTQVT